MTYKKTSAIGTKIQESEYKDTILNATSSVACKSLEFGVAAYLKTSDTISSLNVILRLPYPSRKLLRFEN